VSICQSHVCEEEKRLRGSTPWGQSATPRPGGRPLLSELCAALGVDAQDVLYVGRNRYDLLIEVSDAATGSIRSLYVTLSYHE
jgi:hypothetical protein